MDPTSRTIAARPDVSVATTAPRVTPTPPRASRFGEVLSNTAVKSAETAMRMLPGSPVMAVAIRSASGGNGALGVPMTSPATVGASPRSLTNGGGASPQGPLASGTSIGASGTNITTPGLGSGATAPGEQSSIESSLQQSADMNMYFLQVQETVNAQNRSFTAISNVMKAEHDTVKTAIGNIR